MTDHPGYTREISDWVQLYLPLSIRTTQWELIRSAVVDSILASSPTLAAARKTAPHAVAFAAWANAEGAISIAEAIADPDWVERYVAIGMPGAAESTRATRRAALRRIGRRLAEPGIPAPIAMRYRTLKPPYQAWECARFEDLSQLQPTASRRQSLAAVLALGLGAGLDGRDMAWVQGCGVRRDAGHVVVRVGGGSRPREVVVLDAYAEHVEHAATGCGERLLIGGSTLGRHNVTSVVLTRMIGDRSLPPLLASRLRSTWLTTHLTLGTPLSLLLPAAGLATARPLGDLLPYVDQIPADAATALLSGCYG